MLKAVHISNFCITIMLWADTLSILNHFVRYVFTYEEGHGRLEMERKYTTSESVVVWAGLHQLYVSLLLSVRNVLTKSLVITR